MFQYQIDPASQVPVYRQLVDQIHAQILSGALKTGVQLPTVREMAEKLRLSCGTVKRIYDCLQEMGDIEMTRRRGTFVKFVRTDRNSRKYQAMNAIDQMIRKLTELCFSPAEIQIFLNLKMREWGMKWTGIRIAVLTDYLELTKTIERQMEAIPNIQVHVWPLRQVQEYPYSVDEESDLILCPTGIARNTAHFLPDKDKCVYVAFAPSMETVQHLAACAGKNIGILCEGEAFFELIKACLPVSGRANAKWIPSGASACFDEFDTIVCAPDLVEQCDNEIREALAAFRGKDALHVFDFRMDEGSMLYLQERIEKLRDEKQQWPTAMRI